MSRKDNVFEEMQCSITKDAKKSGKLQFFIFSQGGKQGTGGAHFKEVLTPRG